MADNLGLGMGIPASSLPTTGSHKMTGSDFAETFEYEFDPRNSELRGGGVSDRIRHERVMELHQRMFRTTWEKATIINMHPFELRHGMGNIGELRVPKKKDNEPYSKFTINRYRISMRDLGDAKFIPQEVLPVEMAEDICLTFKDFGGVFWYRGVGEPSPEELSKAYDEQLNFYKREYEKAVDFWARRKQLSLITEHARSAARELFRVGLIAQLPEWCIVTREQASVAFCENCGNDIKKTAKTCPHCGFIIDLEFYKANKERFAANAGVRKAAPIPQPLDDSRQITESFMAEDDPDALNHIKNLDEKIANDLQGDELTKAGRAAGAKPSRVAKL